jgi:methyl-accepting chemotaxis protein
VVAGEVKTLAAQTAKATSEIATQIETVRVATGEAVTAMAEIGGIIAKINEVSSAIAAAVEQQSATTREIATSLQVVTSATAGTAKAMEQVVSVSDAAGNLSRDVLSGAANIGSEAQKLRTEVDQFLAAVREETTDERRRYERIQGNGVMVGLRAPGWPATRVELRNVSRGGAAMASDWSVAAGTAVEVELPNGGGTVPARVARSSGGELAVVFSAEPQALAQIDRALAALTHVRRAA